MNTAIMSALLLTSLFVPTWHGNYSQAQKEAANQKKPLLVVFGTGANGWSKIIRDQTPSGDVSKLLLKDYVCVYVDTDAPSGRLLADTFELRGKQGMVISDRTLSTQAFWHEGDMTHERALHYLQKYAQPNIVVQGTETAAVARVSYYQGPTSGIGYQPQGFAAPNQGFAAPSRGFSSGSC